MARAVLNQGPRALSPNRADVFQNLLLTTLAVVTAPFAPATDFGRPIPQRQAREDVLQQPFQLRSMAGGTAAFQIQTPDLGRPRALLPERADVAPVPVWLLNPGPTPIAPNEVGGRAVQIQNRREDPAQQSFQLRTMAGGAVAIASQGPHFGQPQPSRPPRDDIQPNMQFVLPVPSAAGAFGGWDEGAPLSLWSRRPDPHPLNLPLFYGAPTPPITANEVTARPQPIAQRRSDPLGSPFGLIQQIFPPFSGMEVLGRPIALRVPPVDPQGTNLQLFPPTGASLPRPVIGWDFGGRAQPLNPGRRAESQGLNLQFFAGTPPVPQVSTETGGRPVQLAVGRSAEIAPLNLPLLGPAFGFMTPIFSIEISGKPKSPPMARWDALGSPASLFGQVSSPFVNPDMGRPIASAHRTDDVLGARFSFAPAMAPICNYDLGRPVHLRRVREDLPQQSFLLLPYMPPLGQSITGEIIMLMNDDRRIVVTADDRRITLLSDDRRITPRRRPH